MKAASSMVETMEYRLALIDPHSEEVLAARDDRGYRLPRVSIPARSRPAEQLRCAAEDRWGLAILILELVATDGRPPTCAAAELLEPSVSPDLHAVRLDEIPPSELLDREYSALDDLLAGRTASPLSRVGWIREAIAWIEAVTARRISSRRAIRQLNAGAGFSLVRFGTDDGSGLWLKATSGSNAHELPVTLLLSRLCGSYLPELIAARPDWNAWLTAEAAGGSGSREGEHGEAFGLLQDAVGSMAELQLKTAGAQADLLEAGAFDQRLARLRSGSGAMFSFMKDAMALQRSTRVAPLRTERIDELRTIFDGMCERLAALGLPETVVHGDMNASNILGDGEHCRFIDWSEASVGVPLVTLEHLLLLNRAGSAELRASRDRALRGLYRSTMMKIADGAALDQASVYTPLLAAACALYGRGDWLGRSAAGDPGRQLFARTIARQMDRLCREPALMAAV